MTEVAIPPSELVKVSELKVDGNNPNKMTPQQHKALSESMTRYGFIVPIITNKDLLIADGEQRLTVAQSLHMTHVPVIRLPVEDVDRRLLRQVLNKLRGEHDLLLDAHEFDKIIEAGHEADLKQLLLLTDSQIERYLTEIHEPKEEAYEIPEIEKIQTDIKRGDIYLLGKHRLMCGDATNKQDIDTLMNGQKIDLGLHDPPYGTKLFGNAPIQYYAGSHSTGHKPSQTYAPLVGDEAAIDPKPLLTLSNKIMIFGANYFADRLPLSRCWIVWDKQTESIENFGHAELVWTNFDEPIHLITHTWHGFRKGNETGQKRLHPTQKPVKLLAYFVGKFTEIENSVLDLFGGSGSTLIACEQTNRTCYMMEIEPRYCQIIINRWEAYTNQKATKLTKNE